MGDKGVKVRALITGASSGIGRELARCHAAAGGDLILVARRENLLKELKEELEKDFKCSVEVIAADLFLPEAAQNIYSEVKARGLQVDYLINNAGLGGYCVFHEQPWKKHQEMIQLNIVALTELSHLFIQDMVKRKSGKILNVSSTAGFCSGPLQAVYYATKAYVLHFSEAINDELKRDNITVTALCPGVTETEFAEKGNLVGSPIFSERLLANAKDVARLGYEGMMKGKAVVIHGAMNKLSIFSLRLMPRSFVVWINRKMLSQ